MDFNSKIINPITKKGALKTHNKKGVKVNFASKSDGHSFSGCIGGDGKGKLSYKGKWMGFGVEKTLNTSGVSEVKLSKSR